MSGPAGTILVISRLDDDLLALVKILRQTEWRLEWWADCAEGCAAMRESAAEVVVCEAELPDGCWRDILDCANSLDEPPSVIVASRLADERLWAEVLNEGGYDLLAKPFVPAEVLWVVMLACGRARQPVTLAKSA